MFVLDVVSIVDVVLGHQFTRELFALSRKVPEEVFVKAAQRGMRYRIVDLSTVRRITWLCLSQRETFFPKRRSRTTFSSDLPTRKAA